MPLFGIIFSALNAWIGPVLMQLLKSLLIKFFVYFGLYFLTTAIAAVLMSSGLLPSASTLQNYFYGLPATVSYFLSVFGIYQGAGMVFTAMATRFIIRRIPLIG